MKLPWLKFYGSDWLSDEALRSCSVESRGLWIDMICLMTKSETYGHLLIGGKPARAEQLGRIVGLTTQRTMELLDELNSAGVFSFEGETIISRRLVKEHNSRGNNNLRVQRWRNANQMRMKRSCNEKLTAKKLEARSQILDNTKAQMRPMRVDWVSYAKEINWSGTDVESAFDYYESNGWKIGGKSPVRDWRACARNCQRRSQEKKQTKGIQPMKTKVVSQCESLPTYKVMGFATREAWVKAGCP
jgi:hypothetical protein